MKNQFIRSFPLILFIFSSGLLVGQTEAGIDKEVTPLFTSTEPLNIRLSYSNKEMKNKTNDSTYLDNMMGYQKADGTWDSIAVRLRARGNYRRKNCYFPPVKVRIKKKAAAGTIFEGNKDLKMVLPCLLQKQGDDKVLCELLAYRIYELLSPYHYKTRRVTIQMAEQRGKKIREHELEGFLIEDIDLVAERHNGNVYKRKVHPLQQDHKTSIQNDYFQFMIGNTDYSSAYQHNEKILFVNKVSLPVPYDFDMSGLVDASYAVVSQIGDQKLSIESVTDRMFRGFKRDPATYEEVRREFIAKKDEVMATVDALESSFVHPNEFKRVRTYIQEFYTILQNDKSFQKEVMAQARIK